MHSFSLVATVLGLVAVASQVNAHGHLIAPFCRNCENENTAIDSLNTPTDLNNVCRGAPPSSTVTKVGRQTTLQIKASAPHVGPCSVFVLDENLGNSIKVADKENCAAPNVDHSWTITFPSNVSGRKVLRWTWEGCHVQPCEHYEQCSDIMIADSGYSTAPTNNTDSNDNSKPVYTAPAPAPVTTPISYDIPITSKPAPAVPAPAAPVTAYSEDTTTSTPAPAPAPVAAPAYSDDTTTTTTTTITTAPESAYPETQTKNKTTTSRLTYSSTEQCTAGAIECRGNAVVKCDHSQWVSFKCASGTTCINGDSVPTCGYPNGGTTVTAY